MISILISYILLLAFLFCLIMAVRVQMVYKFIKNVNELCYEYSIKHVGDSAYDWCMPKFEDFNYILCSFKRLRLESFLTKEEIERLFS